MSESNSISAGNISSGTVIAGDKNIVGNNNVIQKDDSGKWEKYYLEHLIGSCDRLDITAIDETCSGEALEISVSDVFTTLYLKSQSIPATEAVAGSKRLVILGGPGSGKSTLVNHIAAESAKKRLNNSSLPLPVMIVLRRFAAWISEECRKGTQGLIWKYLEYRLQEIGCEEFLSFLKLEIAGKGGILFLDGLDEVRESDEDKRSLILDAIRDFAACFDKCRMVVTCREYAYRPENQWRLPESLFPVVRLDVFRSKQIKMFTRTWYRITGKWKDWNDRRCLDEADDLCQAVESRPLVRKLAETPLLLTLMAQVHIRVGKLPDYRAELYDLAVKLLLANWEKRIHRDIGGTCRADDVPILDIRTDALRSALERVALSVHEKQEKEKGDRTECADISKEDLRDELIVGLGNDPKKHSNKAEEVIEYIRNRAGLLLAHDNRTFRFPHRTFQEFLAGTGIMEKSDCDEFLQERIARDQSWWQEVFLLAAGSRRNTPKMIYGLIDRLIPYNPDEIEISSETVRFAQLAAQAMNETEFLKHVHAEQKSKPNGRYSKIHTRVQKWLLTAMTADNVLTPEERCEAGNALNWVGDPRFNPERWYLPYNDDGFVNIPAGSFMMGSDKKRDKDAYNDEFSQHRVTLSAYSIGRYPVTVAQFRVFVQETGYDAGEQWSSDPDNHPVVNVSWYDAVAYCEWLTEKLRDRSWKIRLPTEAEWEYAARGTDGRIYPWGDDPIDPNKANYGDTRIGTTSAVGCFPSGNNSCGLSDMAGNVWEWCQDWYGGYPADAVFDPIGAETGSYRVLRGGSWFNVARLCRTADRYSYSPGYRHDNLGFRLVHP